MKVAIFVLGLTFSSYASSMDYSHCAKVVSNLGGPFSDSFVSMDAKTGEIQVHRGKGSMKTEGNKVIYSAFEVESKVKESNGLKVITPKKITDKEELVLTYEKIEKGSAPEKLKSITYSFKESKVRQAGSFQIDFNEKNGTCVPEVKNLDLFSGFGKVTRFFTNKVFGKITKAAVGAKDIYKCRALHEELAKMGDIKDCMSKAPQLKKLKELTIDLVLNDPKYVDLVKKEDVKEYEEKIKSAFDAYSYAQSSLDLCDIAGYDGVIEDDAYWTKIRASETKEEVKTESISR